MSVKSVRNAIEVEPGVDRLRCPFCHSGIRQPFARASGPQDGTHRIKSGGLGAPACRVVVEFSAGDAAWLIQQVPSNRSIERVLSERSRDWQGET